MSRLVAFGCSYTYGHGLPDCHIPPDWPGEIPSNLSWPSLLARDLSLELINVSKPGISNAHILWYLLNFSFKDDDICIVMWTHFNRYPVSILNNDPSKMEWDSYEDVKYTPNQLEDKNLTIKNFISIHHAYLHLTSKKIKHKFLLVPWPEYTYTLPSQLFIPTLIRDIHLGNMLIDTALDKLHPGLASHNKIAKAIYKELNVIR
jgi:hypothetical protein